MPFALTLFVNAVIAVSGELTTELLNICFYFFTELHAHLFYSIPPAAGGWLVDSCLHLGFDSQLSYIHGATQTMVVTSQLWGIKLL